MSGYLPPHKRNQNRGSNHSNSGRFNRQDDRDDGGRDDNRNQRGFGHDRQDRQRGYGDRGWGRSERYNNNGRSNNRFDRRDPTRDNNQRRGGGKTSTGMGGDIRSRSNNSGGRFSRSRLSNKASRELSTDPDPDYERELFGANRRVAMGINFSEYDKIPVDVSGVDCPAAIEAFDELLVSESLLNNIQLCKFSSPTPIQKYSIPTVLADRDLMACAQTGSGKTAAFLIPVVETLSRRGPDTRQFQRSKYYPRALILAPTRELAQQIHVEARKLLYCSGMRAVCVYGGAAINEQFNDLASGVDLLVATPGRLMDMMDRGRIALQKVGFLVLDEADRMLDMGFEPQIRKIVDDETMPPAFGHHPDDFTRRTLMYSATFPDEIQNLAQDFLHEYIFLAVGRVGSTTALITQQLKYVESAHKTDELLDLIPTLKGKTLVFTATKRTADSIEGILCRNRYSAITIHGDKTQEQREYALKQFRSGDTNIMVATDVAARGLDIPDVQYVVQYDLPGNIDDYVHRIGRTGRRGNVGTALSFTNEQNRPIFEELLKLLQEAKQEIPSWFTKMVSNSQFNRRNYRGGNRRNDRGGRNHYGGRDVREPTRKPAETSKNSVNRLKQRSKKKVVSNDAW